MKRSKKRGTALLLSAVLVGSIAMTGACAEDSAFKEETVYVMAGADGSAQKIIVSDWLKNTAGSQKIDDKTELTDVENVKGEETFETGSDGALVWDAQGKDIYYQGSTDKELPVDVCVSYFLDGEEISAKDLAGKSGRVTIRFDYDNKQAEEAEINGEKETICVPFAMLTGVLLDNDVFTNVEVTNGRLINDGDHMIAVGIAFPGMQKCLNVPEDKLQIPDYVEITGDAEKFALDMTVTLGTNEWFRDINLDDLDMEEELESSLEDLSGAMERLSAGAEALKNGAGDLDAGASALQDGAAQLCEGLNALVSNNDSLNAGAGQVFETLLATAGTQLAAAGLDVPELTIENYADVLNEVAASLEENAVREKALEQVTAAVEEQRAAVEEQVTAAVRETVAEQVVNAAAQMDKASYDAAVEAGLVDEQTQAAVEAAIDQQMADAQIRQTVKEKTEEQIQQIISEHMESEEVTEQLAAAAQGSQSIAALKESLDSYNTFYLGLQSYTEGVQQASAGAGELKTGTEDLKGGAGELLAGTEELYEGILTLKDGSEEEGAAQSGDELAEIKEQGLTELLGTAKEDLAGMTERLRAAKEISENYKSFAGIAESMDGQVKFIYRTDSIE